MARLRLRDDLVDWALALFVAAGAMLQQRGCSCRMDPIGLNAVLLLLATLPIGLRRRQPFPVFVVVGLAAFTHILLGFTNSSLLTFAVLVAMFSVASYGRWALSVLAAASTALLLPVNFLVDWGNHGHVELSDIPYNHALFGAAWILGDNLRREREQAQLAMRLRTEEEERSRRAVADERSRIARELQGRCPTATPCRSPAASCSPSEACWTWRGI